MVEENHLRKGAVALVMHGMEFANGNQVARDCAQGVLSALGPDDELGVVLWDGTERWLFLQANSVHPRSAADGCDWGVNLQSKDSRV